VIDQEGGNIMQTTTSWEEKGWRRSDDRWQSLSKRIALNLLRQGLSMDSIAQATGLTIAQLQELQG
jgi:predicted transposase YdaD